jgi:hypothetical protein
MTLRFGNTPETNTPFSSARMKISWIVGSLSNQPVSLVWIRKGSRSNRALLAWLELLWPDAVKRLEQGEKL